MSSSLQDLKPTSLELFLKAWSEGKCHAWWKCVIKAGSLSGRPDILSLLSHLCNKDEERSLLFILVFLLVSIYLLAAWFPLGAGGAPTAPAVGLLPKGSTCRALTGIWGRHCPLLGPQELKVPPGLHPSALRITLALLHGVRGAMQGLSWGRISGWKKQSREGMFLNYFPMPGCLFSIGLAKMSFK